MAALSASMVGWRLSRLYHGNNPHSYYHWRPILICEDKTDSMLQVMSILAQLDQINMFVHLELQKEKKEFIFNQISSRLSLNMFEKVWDNKSDWSVCVLHDSENSAEFHPIIDWSVIYRNLHLLNIYMLISFMCLLFEAFQINYSFVHWQNMVSYTKTN